MISWWAGSAAGPDGGVEVDASVVVGAEVGALVEVDVPFLDVAEVVDRSVVVVPPMLWSSLPHDEPRESTRAAAMAAATSRGRGRGAGCGCPVEDTGALLSREDPCPTTAEHPARRLVIAAAEEGNRSAFSRDGWFAS
jgi:hypothetical protein